MRESALWKKLRAAMPSAAMAARIENSAGEGMPDVLMTYRGMTVLIELKTDSDSSTIQADWHRRWTNAGGTSWFLVDHGESIYLVPGKNWSWPDFRRNVFWSQWRVRNCREAIEKIFQGAK